MYSLGLARALGTRGIEAVTAIELGLAGLSDSDLLDAAVDGAYVLLTENVADFARLVSERLAAGANHPGVLIALSSRFSRRPSGLPSIAAAVAAVELDELESRLVYLEAPHL